MDRGLLSEPSVVAASREFVCIRLLTYESKEEGLFLGKVFRGRTGQLENSVFAVLAPDGTQLTRGGRSPEMVFRGSGREGVAEAMVTAMKKIATDYPGRSGEADSAGERSLPVLEDLRRAMNASACDIQPLVIVADSNPKTRAQRVSAVQSLAWSPEFIGTFAYVVVSDLSELAKIEGAPQEAGTFVVQTDAYGLAAKVLSQTDSLEAPALESVFQEGHASFKGVAKDSREHIQKGRKDGKNWEPEIPVTDPHGPKPDRKRARL